MICVPCRLALLLACFAMATVGRAPAQAGAGVTPSEPRFHIIRSVSGSHSVQQDGRYVVEDARSTFYVPADKQIVVYFEWDGPVGNHHFEGFWKNPEGKVVVISDFTYEAKQKRFGAYWTLNLSEGIVPGIWTLEAHVDGELAGAHTIQIVAAPKPAEASQPVRPLLSPAEVYRRALQAGVFIDNLDMRGQRQGRGLGFFVGDGLLLTAFQVIDGAVNLRLLLPDGRAVETAEVAAWNRLEDWAVLKAAVAAPATLKLAVPKSWAVGDRCFTFNVPAEGNRVLVDENVIGTNAFPELGERLNLSFPAPSAAAGAPVVNEYGEVIGILGGSLYPGAHAEDEGAYTVRAVREGGMATPVSVVTVPSAVAPTTTLAKLDAAGQFVPRVSKQPELLYGLLATGFDTKRNEFPTARENSVLFSRKDGRLAIVLIWNPRSKLKGEIALAIYDLHNQPVVRTEPSRVKMSAGTYFQSAWNLNVKPLNVGGYRADVLQDGQPIWRAYFRITE
jgi:hypothetical protein